jgi:hypothetical protein
MPNVLVVENSMTFGNHRGYCRCGGVVVVVDTCWNTLLVCFGCAIMK